MSMPWDQTQIMQLLEAVLEFNPFRKGKHFTWGKFSDYLQTKPFISEALKMRGEKNLNEKVTRILNEFKRDEEREKTT